MQLSAGTLYSSIRRMLEQGLIEELARSPDPSSTDERRRYYRLTRFGKTGRGGGSGAAERPGAAGASDGAGAGGLMRAAAIYRALLHCYPAAFRDEYGEQMLPHVRRAAGRSAANGTARFEQASLWIQAAVDALTVAPKEHAHVSIQDLRYAFRTMAARPGFTVVADPVAGARHRRQYRDLQLVERRAARPAPGVHKPGELVMFTNPGRSRACGEARWEGRTDGPRAWLTYDEFEQLRDHAERLSRR